MTIQPNRNNLIENSAVRSYLPQEIAEKRFRAVFLVRTKNLALCVFEEMRDSSSSRRAGLLGMTG